MTERPGTIAAKEAVPMTIARVRISKIKVKPSALKKCGFAYWLHFNRLVENGREVEAVFSSLAGLGINAVNDPQHGIYGREE